MTTIIVDGQEITLSGAAEAAFNAARTLPPAPVPSVSPRQLRLWLVRQGIALAVVEAALAELPEPQRSEALIEWEYALEYRFDQPLVQGIGGAIGLDQLQIAAGMREAALI